MTLSIDIDGVEGLTICAWFYFLEYRGWWFEYECGFIYVNLYADVSCNT